MRGEGRESADEPGGQEEKGKKKGAMGISHVINFIFSQSIDYCTPFYLVEKGN
jgi:hypothetical protein